MAAGPDGALWAAVAGGAARIAPDAPTTFVNDGIDPAAQGLAIAAGPDGHMWMTLDRAPYLVKIDVPPRIDDVSVTRDGPDDDRRPQRPRDHGQPRSIRRDLASDRHAGRR